MELFMHTYIHTQYMHTAVHVRHIAAGLSGVCSLFACPAPIFSELQQPLDDYSI